MHGINRRISRLRQALFLEADYLPLEAANIYWLLLWTVAVLPPQTDIFAAGRAYTYIAHVMSEAQFGAIFLFLLLNAVFALMHGNLWYRLASSATQTFIYGTLLFLFMNANPHSVIALLVGGSAVFSFFVSARLVRDIRDHVPPWTL